MVQRYDTILCTSSPAYNVEPVTNTSSSSSCANNDDERRRECLARRLPPFVTALFFTLRHSYGLQYCRPVCSKARYSSRIAFPSYSNRKCKKSPFLRTAAHIFVFPGDASAIITQYVAWMERQFNACQTPRSMYPSIFNSFPVIWTASAKKSPFSRSAAHIFISPGDAPSTGAREPWRRWSLAMLIQLYSCSPNFWDNQKKFRKQIVMQ